MIIQTLRFFCNVHHFLRTLFWFRNLKSQQCLDSRWSIKQLVRTQLCKFLQCVDLKTMGGAPPPPCSPPPLAPFPLYSSSSSSSSCSWMVSSPGPAAQQPRQLSFTASSGRPPVLQTTHHPIIRVVSFYVLLNLGPLYIFIKVLSGLQ